MSKRKKDSSTVYAAKDLNEDDDAENFNNVQMSQQESQLERKKLEVSAVKGKVRKADKNSFCKYMGILHVAVGFPLALALYFYYNIAVNPSTSQIPGPIVQISSGLIQGVVEQSRDGREFYQFLGIPYGTAERFEVPKPFGKWADVRSANEFGSPCLQLEFFTGKLLGQEDCLFLNVFTPIKPGEHNNAKLVPVMVFIHGGYFMSGSSSSYRADYFMDEDVVLVTLNYRLASLGFLNTGDDVVPGNMGLKDQNMALQWIQENIAKFNGDSSKVTIFGPSAGAAGVHYHMLSPLSKGLFRSAISESGTAVKVWSFVDNPRRQAARFAEKLNCPTKTSQQLVNCLKKIDGNILISAHMDYLDVLLDPLAIFAPSVERHVDKSTFLPGHPYTLLVEGKNNRVPWLTGLNSDEGLLFSARILKNSDILSRLKEDWQNTLPALLGYSEHPNKNNITDAVTRFYFQSQESPNYIENFQNYTNMLSDRLYFTATHESILVQTRYSPVYTYYYTYPAQFSFSQVLTLTGRFPPLLEFTVNRVLRWVQENILRQTVPNLGVCHGDELVMLFNLGVLTSVKPEDKDYFMSKKMVKIWTDFASLPSHTEGDYPDKVTLYPLEVERVKWYPLSTSPAQLNYFNLDTNSKIIKEPFTERVHFWKSMGLL